MNSQERRSPERNASAAFMAWLPRLFQDQFGLRLKPASAGAYDLAFHLMGAGVNRRFLAVEVKPRWLRADMKSLASAFRAAATQDDTILILAIPALSDRAQRELRDAAINYVDLNGALHVQAPGLYIHADSAVDAGHREPLGGARTGARDSSLNPFTDAASVVLRLLLAAPDRPWRIQDLAASGGMSMGWVATVVQALEARGYARRSQHGSGRESDLRLADAIAVLRDWGHAYSWRANAIVSYNVPLEYPEIMQRIPALVAGLGRGRRDITTVPVGLTLLSASDLYAAHVQHEQVDLYVGAEVFADANEYVQRAWHGEVTERGGNVHLLQPSYRRSVFVDARVMQELPVVSPVQLYLDLLHYPLRGAEAAGMLARTVLGPGLRLSSRQIQELIP